MRVRVTSKRQVTFPKKVMEAMAVKPGDSLEIQEQADGFLIRPHRIKEEYLAPLRGRIDLSKGPFDLQKFRDEPKDPSLRD